MDTLRTNRGDTLITLIDMINMGVYFMSEEAEVTKTLDALTIKIDEISKALKENKELTEARIKENPLDALTIKIDELSKALKENKELTEARIKENPLAYMAGAFAGGLLLGYLIARKS
jgi:ElaB/YqjD/DUF883 family membrane-anchored ribosome-binding protein